MSKNIGKDLKEAILGIEVTQFDGQKADLEELVNPKQLEKIISDWMPEVLSQEWIDEYEQGDYGEWVYTEDLQNLIVPTLSKKKKVQLPQKKADELNRYKEFGYSLKDLLVIAGSKQAQEKLARAWLDGYEVEEEQKYNVKFKVKSSFGTVGIFLYKEGDEVLAGDNFKVYYQKEDVYRLTEQEIRDFQNGDILFEHFAVPVEELEE